MKKTDYCENAFEILQLRGYSDNTIQAYLPVIKRFFDWVDVPPTKVKSEHFDRYFRTFRHASNSKKNQVINALKFLCNEVMKKKYKLPDFKRPRGEKKIPRTVNHEHLMKSLANIENLKHRAILTLAYSDGLRISEVINLKIEDIDSKNHRIFIRNAKGRKDRIVPLSDFVLHLLRCYFRQYRPKVYLFNGQRSLQYSETSCRKLVKKYIGDIRFHDLRHSCATYLVEKDTNENKVAQFLGHTNTRTVATYTHLSAKSLQGMNLPC